MSARVHATIAAAAALAFPAAGLATELGHLSSAAFVGVAVGCCVTFASATYALSRRPARPGDERPTRAVFGSPAAYLQ